MDRPNSRLYIKEDALEITAKLKQEFTLNSQEILEEVVKKAKKGDPDDVLRVIDEYCWRREERSISVGDEKDPVLGKILDKLLSKTDPTIVLELGTFVGYGAVRMARLLSKPDSRLYTIEVHKEFAETAEAIIEFAGLKRKVTVILGETDKEIPKLSEKFGFSKIDFVFLDHWEKFYKPDLMRLLDVGLIQNGTLVVADNVIWPGVPDYLEFVRNHPKFESKLHEAHLEYTTDEKDGLEESLYLG